MNAVVKELEAEAIPVSTALALQGDAQNALTTAKLFVIAAPEQLVVASSERGVIKGLIKKTKAALDDELAPHLEKVEEIRKKYKPAQGWLAEADTLLAKALKDYAAEQEAAARKLQAKADEAARAQRAALQQKAAKEQAAGRTEKALALEAQAMVTAPRIVAAAPKIEGLSYRTYWHFKVTDEAQIPVNFKIVDMKKIQGIVDTMKADAMTLIPGIEVWSEKMPINRAVKA